MSLASHLELRGELAAAIHLQCFDGNRRALQQAPVLNHQLLHWESTYNCVRPHQSLAYLTPLELITRWKHNQRKAKCH